MSARATCSRYTRGALASFSLARSLARVPGLWGLVTAARLYVVYNIRFLPRLILELSLSFSLEKYYIARGAPTHLQLCRARRSNHLRADDCHRGRAGARDLRRK